MERYCLFFMMVFAVTAALTACTPSEQSTKTSPSLTFYSCRLGTLSMAVECATLDVPLKRDDPAHKEKISLRVIRLPANTPHPASDPFVMLAGGPGQAASALAPFAAAQVEIRRTRDILLIDQRGTGQSAPLQCATLDDADDTTLRNSLTLEIVSRVQCCHEELREQNRDPLDYGTLHFVADLDDVRRALGVNAINVWAGSYGTRVAL